jgi:acyl-CoA hydrolase
LTGAGLGEMQLARFHAPEDLPFARKIHGGRLIRGEHWNALLASRASGGQVHVARADHSQLNRLGVNHGSLLSLRQGLNLLSENFSRNY